MTGQASRDEVEVRTALECKGHMDETEGEMVDTSVALAALDRLVAERAEALMEASEYEREAADFEASQRSLLSEACRLKAALTRIAAHPVSESRCDCHCTAALVSIARCALDGETGTRGKPESGDEQSSSSKRSGGEQA